MDQLNKIVFSLQKLPEDIRDYSHHVVFGTITPLNIPSIDFDVSPLPPIILDQIDLDFCTAFASSELNTNFDTINLSLVDYLNSKKQNSSLIARSKLALNYGLVDSLQTYISLSVQKLNSNINLQLLSNLIKDNGDYFDPLYFMAKIKQIRRESTLLGANLRDATMAATTYGFIKKNQSPFTHAEEKSTDKTRDFLANWRNWPISLDLLASINKLDSFFTVDGPYDAFDNIRSALFKNYQSNTPCGVLFGLNWRSEWTYMSKGIVDESYPISSGNGHCVYLRGIKYINGVPFIKMQQSWGINIGDKGIFYLSRDVINKEFAAGYGAFIFKKLSKQLASYYNNNNIKDGTNWFLQLIIVFKNFFKK